MFNYSFSFYVKKHNSKLVFFKSFYFHNFLYQVSTIIHLMGNIVKLGKKYSCDQPKKIKNSYGVFLWFKI